MIQCCNNPVTPGELHPLLALEMKCRRAGREVPGLDSSPLAMSS